MTHPDEGRLRALLDEQLQHDEAEAVRVHVGSCLVCDAALRRAEETQVLATALLHALDVAAPVARVRARLAERRTMEARVPRRAWTARSDLAKAALLVLAFSGAVAAAVHPASPLRRLLGGAQPTTAAAPTSVEAPVAASAPREVGVRVSVAGPVARVALTGAADGAVIEATWVDAGAAAVYAPEGTTFATSDADGRIDAALAPGAVRIELPRAVARVSLSVNGRVYMEKTGERVDFPGPAALVDGQRVRFEVR